jgi:hypothetical protein
MLVWLILWVLAFLGSLALHTSVVWSAVIASIALVIGFWTAPPEVHAAARRRRR